MILSGNNYNIRNPNEEINRLSGGGLYNPSQQEYFDNLNSSMSGGSVNTPSRLEYIERVESSRPRQRINNITHDNVDQSISGLSTAGIKKQKENKPLLNAKLILANTKRQMGLNQKLLP